MHRFSVCSLLSKWKKGDPPSPPWVHLSPGTHSQSEGVVLLSEELRTDREIDDTVDQLKTELEEFRKKAKEELRRLRAIVRGK